MHTRIPEMRDPSKWKFPKRGIPQFRNSKTRESIHFCSFLQEISSFYKCFFSTKLGFTISKFHRRISILAVYVKYWTINHFSHSYKRRHLLAIFSSNPSFWKFLFWGIPRFGNFHFEGSLVLEISILRDPSFQEFWDRHETNRLFRRSNSVFRPDFSI